MCFYFTFERVVSHTDPSEMHGVKKVFTSESLLSCEYYGSKVKLNKKMVREYVIILIRVAYRKYCNG